MGFKSENTTFITFTNCTSLNCYIPFQVASSALIYGGYVDMLQANNNKSPQNGYESQRGMITCSNFTNGSQRNSIVHVIGATIISNDYPAFIMSKGSQYVQHCSIYIYNSGRIGDQLSAQTNDFATFLDNYVYIDSGWINSGGGGIRQTNTDKVRFEGNYIYNTSATLPFNLFGSNVYASWNVENNYFYGLTSLVVSGQISLRILKN